MAILNFPSTRLDGSPLQPDDQYIGDNGVTYIFDGVKWAGHATAQPVSANSITNNGNTVQVDSAGNLITPSYIFPNASGTTDQVLTWPNSGNILLWANQSGAGGLSWQLTSGTSVLSLDSNGTLKTIDPNLQIQVGESYAPFWIAEYGGLGANPTDAAVYGTGAVYDSVGNLYIIGTAQYDGSTTDSLMLKYDPAGNLLWHKTWRDPINGGNCGSTNVAIAIDQNDRIYWVANDWTAGGMWTGYFDTDGNLGLGGIAQQVLGISNLNPTDLACDTSGNYYISGNTGGVFSAGQPIVVKINGNTGVVLWSSDLTPIASDDTTSTGVYRAITVNPETGDVWAVGDYIDNGDRWAMLTKWNSLGIQQWTNKLVTYSGDLGEAVVFNNGYVYTVVNDGTDVKTVVSKFNTNGTLVWASNLAVGASHGYDLSFDSAHNVYLTGIIEGQLWLTKLDPVTGTMLYSRVISTTSNEYILDGSGDPIVGHRVGDIYQDKIAISAVTSGDLTQVGTNFNPRILVAQLPINGSIIGTFSNVTISDITGDISGISSTGTYTVTTLSWTTGTVGTNIGTLSQLSASAVTTVGKMSGEIINISTGTRSTNWNFSQDGGLVFPDGTIQTTAAQSGTRWDATPVVEGCPIYAELNPDHFQVYTQQSHLEINNDATWHIGSNFNSNGLFSIDNTATLYSNFGEVVVRTGDSSKYFTFGGDGSLTLPLGNKITAAMTPSVGKKVTGIETYTTSTGGNTYSWHLPDCPNLVILGYNNSLVALGSRFYPVGHLEQAVTITGGAGNGTDNTITFSGALGAGPYVIESSDYVAEQSNPVVVQGHLLPSSDLSYDLGSTSSQWRSIYVGTGTIYIGGIALGVDQNNYVTVDGNPIITVNTAGNLTIQGDVGIGTVYISNTAPLASTGTQWFNTVDARTYIAYNNQWVDASPTLIPSPATYLDDIEIEDSTIFINGSTLTINTSGTLLVNGEQVSGSGGGAGDRLTSGTSSLVYSQDGSLYSTNTVFITAVGTSSFGAFGWVDSFTTATRSAGILAGGTPVSTSTGDLIVFAGNVSGPFTNQIWTFGANGVLTLSTASTILGNSDDPNVYIETSTTATTSIWTFGTNGITTFPDGTTSTGAIIRAAQSSSYIIQTLGPANASPSNVVSTFEFGVDGMITLPQGSTIGETTATTVITPPGALAGQSLVIRATTGTVVNTETSHIHLLSGNPATTDIYLGDDDQYVKIEKNGGNVVIGTSITGIPNGLANWNGGGGWNLGSYINTATTGGSGSGLTVDVAGGGGYININSITIHTPGTGYTDGDVITINNENNIPGTFTISISDATNAWTFSNTGTVTFPDATVQRTAYPTGQHTVLVNSASTSTPIVISTLTGTVVWIDYDSGYSTDSEHHYVTLPFQDNPVNPNIPLGTRITVINRYSGTVEVSGWPPGGGYQMQYGESIDLVYYYEPQYSGNLWWVTNSYIW